MVAVDGSLAVSQGDLSMRRNSEHETRPSADGQNDLRHAREAVHRRKDSRPDADLLEWPSSALLHEPAHAGHHNPCRGQPEGSGVALHARRSTDILNEARP